MPELINDLKRRDPERGKQTMNKTTQLFIRACKSADSEKRVHSVYRRFYLASQEDNSGFIANILLGICQNYDLYRLQDLACDLSPGSLVLYGPPDNNYWHCVMRVAISKIQLSERSKFPGLTWPARSRRKEQ